MRKGNSPLSQARRPRTARRGQTKPTIIRHALALLTAMLLPGLGAAQSTIPTATPTGQGPAMPPAEESRFAYSVFEALNTYALDARISDAQALEEFSQLFESTSVSVYNDLIGLAHSPTLTVADYGQTMLNEARMAQVDIHDIRRGQARMQDEMWMMDVTFDKALSYTNTCGVLFSSQFYLSGDHHMTATFVWDGRRALIRSLTGTADMAPGKEVPEAYEVLEQSDRYRAYDLRLRLNGRPLAFNDFGQAIIPAGQADRLSLGDPDIAMQREVGDAGCGLFTIRYQPRHWRLRLHALMPVGDCYDLDAPSGLSASSSGWRAGLDVGYSLPLRSPRLRLTAFTGLGIAQSQLSLSLGQTQFYVSQQDIDGDYYERHYDISQMTQKVGLTDLIIPLYADGELRMTTWLSAYADLGVRAYFNLKADVSSASTTYSARGYYSQYDGLWLDQRTGIEGFTDGQTLTGGVDAPSMESMTLDLWGGVGVRIGLGGPFMLEVGAEFQHTLQESIVSTSDTATPQPLRYRDGREEVDPLIDHFEGIKRGALSLRAGLMMKF